MSTASFATGSKTENALYAAFGIVLGFTVVKLFWSQMLQDPLTALTLGIFWGSILGSFAFFVRIDRSVVWLIKQATLFKYRQDIEKQLIRTDVVMSVWRFMTTDTWQSPKQRTTEKLDRLMEGPDLREDVWSMKGAFYFGLALPLLLYDIDMPASKLLWLLPSLELLLIAVALYNHRKFLVCCSFLASYRSLQEARSVIELRRKHGNPAYASYASRGVEPFSGDSLGIVLDELGSMVDRRDWMGFQKRMEYLLDDIEQEMASTAPKVLSFYVESWAGVLGGYDESARQMHLVETSVLKQIIECAIQLGRIQPGSDGLLILLKIDKSNLGNSETFFKTIDEAGMKSEYEQSIYPVFRRLLNPPVSKIITEIVLRWYKEGKVIFAESLLVAADSVDAEVRERIIDALLSHKDEQIWRNSSGAVVGGLIRRREKRAERALLSALRGGNRSIIHEILKEASTDDYEMLREVISYVNHEDPTIAMEAVMFFMRVDTALMKDYALPRLFKEEESMVRLNTLKFPGRL